MKKSVIVLIGIIYILAIVVVSFFGLKIETFNETVYVSGVHYINEDIKVSPDGTKYVVITYVDDPDNPTSYQLEWRVDPDDATRKIVSFAYDESKSFVTVNEFGAVIFSAKGSITVYVNSTDGSAKTDAVTIIAK
jgi:hypothetical protein